MGLLFDLILDATIGAVVRPGLDAILDPAARRYRRALSRGLLAAVWGVTVAAVWVGMRIGVRWSSGWAQFIAVGLVLGMPAFALVSTLTLRDKMTETGAPVVPPPA